MEKNMFYNHVSSWIDSYYNAEALEWLRRFINNSTQPQDIRDRLQQEVNRKIASLTNMPFFGKYDDMELLMDQSLPKQDHPAIFTTRYAAMSKIAQLRQMGYDARLLEGNAFYRIQLVQPAPVNFLPPADDVRINVTFEQGMRMSA